MESKKKLVLVPSAYNIRAMDDIANFIPLYKDVFDVYVIADKDSKKIHVVKDDVHYVRAKSKLATYLIATADYIIDAGTITGASKYSASQYRVSVWHGIPYKSMFLDLGKEHAVGALDYDHGVDLMVSPSSWYTEHFLRQSMLYQGEVLECAISKTDALFLDENQKAKVRKSLRIPDNKKILLYAPTYREPGPITLPFSPKKVLSALGKQDWVVVTKLHYLNTLVRREDVIDATSCSSIDELLSIADLLVTDYSSLIFDYSILEKPCLLYQYDREEYQADRSFMFNMEDYVAAEDIIFTEDELIKRLKSIETIQANLDQLRRNFYPHQKPYATEELVKKLNFNSQKREVSEVIFLVNQLNQIGGVHTFVTNFARELKRRYNSKVILIGNEEFDYAKDKAYIFDSENLFDIKLSFENNRNLVGSILENTDGYIIACQYGVHREVQKFLKGQKAVLMFHGDTKDVVNRNIYKAHLDGYNNEVVYNYRRLVLLTKNNYEVLKPHLVPKIRDKATYIENGMDFSGNKDFYCKNGEFAFVSRLDPDKNPLEAIELFSNTQLDSSYHLNIYGDGSLYDEMQAMIKERGLQERITLHGYVEDKEVIYRNKQGVISISLTEGLPYTIIEATAYGLPAYVYNSFTSATDVVTETTGVLVPAGNQQALVDALNHPFDMSVFDNSEVIARFSNDAAMAKWETLFRELDDEVIHENKSQRTAMKFRHKVEDETHQSLLSRAKKIVRESSFFQKNLRYARVSALWRKVRQYSKRRDWPLVSIIMPYYNDEATIQKTVWSVAKSGYKNYEIILVNDGSPNNPMEQLKRYGEKIRYFYKENGGPSSARNYGINQANGKYVFYLDSGDLLHPGSLTALVSYAEVHNLPMVCGKTIRRYVEQDMDEIWMPAVYRKTYTNNRIFRYRLVDDTISTAKLYKRSALQSIGITFKDGLYEDILYTGELYAKMDKIGVVNNRAQIWMVYGVGSSITTTISLESVKARLQNVEDVFDLYDGEVIKFYLTRQYIRHQLIASLNGWQSYTDEEKKELYALLRDGVLKREKFIFDKLIVQPSKKLLYQALLADDFGKFSFLAESFSEIYLAFHRNQEKS